MKAVKQGSAAIGLRSRSHVVLASVDKAVSELSFHQRKIFKINDRTGIAMAGLATDGRVLFRYLTSECINYSFVYECPLPVGRLVGHLADKAQVYLEREFETLNDRSREELIQQALLAIKETLRWQGKEFDSSSCTVAILGENEAFHIVNRSIIEQLVDSLDPK